MGSWEVRLTWLDCNQRSYIWIFGWTLREDVRLACAQTPELFFDLHVPFQLSPKEQNNLCKCIPEHDKRRWFTDVSSPDFSWGSGDVCTQATRPRSVWDQNFNCAAHKHNFKKKLKKIEPEPAITWKLVTCQRITSKNTWPRWVDTWARDKVKWYRSPVTLFWQLSIGQNIDVQYVCII